MKHAAIHTANPMILASASPRRRQLLEQIGLPSKVIPSKADEQGAADAPEGLALRFAAEKAQEVFSRVPGSWTLGADTLVVVGERVLGKPADDSEAGDMLKRLSGREHRVITGFCVLDPAGGNAHIQAVTTLVRFKTLSAREIAGYVATGEPRGKAGAYAIQGIGAFLVEGIFGSYTNVVGLPVCALVRALLATGALNAFPLTP